MGQPVKFQPIFVYTDEHVRAHYTICILSYLLDVTITNRLRENRIEGVSSVNKVYSILERCEIGKLGMKGDKSRILKLASMTSTQKNIMEGFIVKNHLFGTNTLTDATTEYRCKIKNSHKAMVLNYNKLTVAVNIRQKDENMHIYANFNPENEIIRLKNSEFYRK